MIKSAVSSYFHESRLKSTLVKISVLLSILLCSCSSDFNSDLLIGYWQVSHTTTKNPISVFDDGSIDKAFVRSYKAIEFEDGTTLKLIGRIGYSSKVCEYTSEKNYVTITSDSEILDKSNILEFKILEITEDELVVGQASEKFFNLTKAEFTKIQ
ncbi:hypothetical protein [Nonlabens agnitus]|uniref:Lipocalin-like domain-containing protein n=1 Tax=Nonlabens agnitus TaxID=870484 RepID=A0A2S9WT65_9FLAO|nr:hypothetical protein [Nonlabens agnitus]PRP66675.1 hypothetical protein BST86_05940 [Nonlabens agnitus]